MNLKDLREFGDRHNWKPVYHFRLGEKFFLGYGGIYGQVYLEVMMLPLDGRCAYRIVKAAPNYEVVFDRISGRDLKDYWGHL